MNKLHDLEKHSNWAQIEKKLLTGLPEHLQNYRVKNLSAGNFLKLLFIQHLYSLNEMALEDKLIDRPSFRRFAGISAGDCPGYSRGLWEFRRQLEIHGQYEFMMDKMDQEFYPKKTISSHKIPHFVGDQNKPIRAGASW